MKILILTTVLLFVSCGQQAPKTKASFNLNVAALTTGVSTADFPGGLILYGYSPTSKRSFSRIIKTADHNEEIPNGEWVFYALGWDTGTTNFISGKIYCAKTPTINLNGSEVTVNLSLSNADCANSSFGPQVVDASPEVNFNFLKSVQICNELGMAGVSSSTSLCTINPDPNTDGDLIDNIYTKGHAVAVRLDVLPFDGTADGVTFINDPLNRFSQCFPIGAGLTISDFNFPRGGAANPFAYRIRAYWSSATCDDTEAHGYKDMAVWSGVHNSTASFHVKSKLNAGLTTETLFVRADDTEVCQPPRNNLVPFAAGDGVAFPYAICDGRQLNSIQDNYNSSSFVLARNISMHPYSTVTLGSAATDCTVGKAENTHAIGMNCSGTVFVTGFSGTFFGRHRTITGMSIEKEDYSSTSVGFVANLAGGWVLNLNFVDSEVSSQNGAGIVAGTVSAGAQVHNVSIKNSLVRTHEYGGIAVGEVKDAASKLAYIKVNNSRLEAWSSSLAANGFGGVVGVVSNSAIVMKAAAHDNTVEGSGNVGGVIGLHSSTGLSGFLASSGLVRSTSDDFFKSHAGGIIGSTIGMGAAPYPLYSQAMVVATGATGGGTLGAGQYSGTANLTTTPPTNSGGGIAFYGEVLIYDRDNTPPAIFTAAGGDVPSSIEPQWVLIGYRYRFPFEDAHPCENIGSASSQKSSGRGTSKTNPVLICTPSDLGSLAGNYYFKQEESFNLSGSPVSNNTQNFSGEYDGNDKMIISAGSHFFSNIQAGAKVEKMRIFNRMNSGTSNAYGIAVNNYGLMSNLVVDVNLESTGNDVSGIVSTNYGDINNVRISGQLVAANDAAGVAIINMNGGSITNVESESSVQGGALGYIGGITGSNDGLINRVAVRGDVGTDATNPSYLGGIAGTQSAAGSIHDAYVDSKAKINVETATSGTIGGIVGSVAGSLRNIYTQSPLLIGSLSPNFGGIYAAGTPSIDSFTLYDEAYKYWAQYEGSMLGSTVCSGGGPYNLTINFSGPNSWPALVSGDKIRVVEMSGDTITSASVYTSTGAVPGGSGSSMLITVNEDCTLTPSSPRIVSLHPSLDAGGITLLDFDDPATYCSDTIAYGSDSDFQCSNGFDLVSFDYAGGAFGEQRIIDAYESFITGQASASLVPIWDYHPGEGLKFLHFK